MNTQSKNDLYPNAHIKITLADHLKSHKPFLRTNPYATYTFMSYAEEWQVQIMATYEQAKQFARGAYSRDNDTNFGQIVLASINQCK